MILYFTKLYYMSYVCIFEALTLELATLAVCWFVQQRDTQEYSSEGGDDTQIYRFELCECILLLNLDKQLPVELFEASRAIRGSSILVISTLPPLKYSSESPASGGPCTP